ncbi:MAG TPA: hypothetical protein VGM62_05225 [Chthoniobacterales bacterium]
MRVLIDECLNWRLGRALTGHYCTSVQRMGWNGIKNGDLVTRMQQERFDVFITGDRNLQFQQHLPVAKIAVVLLAAKSTKLADTVPLMPEVLARLPALQPGTITVIPSAS